MVHYKVEFCAEQIPEICVGTDLTKITKEQIKLWVKANYDRYLDEGGNAEFHEIYDTVVAYVQFLYAIDTGIYKGILKAIVGQNIEIQ